MIHEPAEMCIEAAVQLLNFRDRKDMRIDRIPTSAAKKLSSNQITRVHTALITNDAEYTPSKQQKSLSCLLN